MKKVQQNKRGNGTCQKSLYQYLRGFEILDTADKKTLTPFNSVAYYEYGTHVVINDFFR